MIGAPKVLIAGGGPAGIATALSLTSRGVSCTVVEPESSGLHKIGETIPPNAKPMLVRSGIDQLLKDPAHLPCYGNSYIWGSNMVSETHFLTQLYQQGWHLNRAVFEHQLKQHAVSMGVNWLQGYRVTQCDQQSNGWDVVVQDGDIKHSISCAFLVDATGRSCRIARLMGQQRIRMDDLVGISSLITTKKGRLQSRTLIEATEQGWWYAAPLIEGKVSLVFMTDSDLVDKRMLTTDYFIEKARKTELVSPILDTSAQIENNQTHLYPASTSILQKRYDSSWLAVGDAAYGFDPISSYGIVSALEGGYYAGHCIADVLSGSSEVLAVYDAIISQAFHLYRKMHLQQYQLEQRWSTSPFWERRSTR